LYNWFYQSVEEEEEEEKEEEDVRLTSVDETYYKELLKFKIRRLIVGYTLIEQLNSLADNYGKLSCRICTITYHIRELLQYTAVEKTLRTDGPAIKRDSESRNIPSSYRIDNGSWNIPSNINYRKIVISPRFVYTEIIDLCYPPHTLNVNLNTNDEELVKYEIDIEANVYVGCKPVSKRQSIVLTRLCDGSILDTNGELITIFETVDLIDLRFAATKSARN
jgi:hypothetical protein